MARFDVYANADADAQEREMIPYFLDVQSDHVLGLLTRVVVPLWSPEFLAHRAANLHPEFQVQGRQVVMDTPSLGAAPVGALQRAVDNLASQQLVIQDALDTLFGTH